MTILRIGDCLKAAGELGNKLNAIYGARPMNVWGIPRGGFGPALMLSMLHPNFVVTDDPKNAALAIDDIVASGRTSMRVMEQYGLKTAALFGHDYDPPFLDVVATGALLTREDGFVNFPWEQTLEAGAHDSAHDAVTRMLCAIGEDPQREGLKETPKRVVKAWGEWFKGYGQDPADVLKVFEDGAEGYREMVLLTNIPVYSHCEHHITPFVGVAHVAYIPDGKIVGLSKLARVVEIFSRRLQVQERLTNQIADALEQSLKPQGVAVVIQAKHFCMATRGVKMPNVDTHTSAMRGAFFDNAATRAEFMSLVRAAS